MNTHPRLMLIQYGDYLTALRGRENGVPETYRAQYYSLDAVDAVVGEGACLVVCLDADPYDVRFGSYRCVAGRFSPKGRGPWFWFRARRAAKNICRLAEEFGPTCLIIRTPGWPLRLVGGWALEQGVPVLPLLADYFPSSFLARLRQWREVALCNNPRLPLVANHNLPASESLAAAGVRAEKIVPWDWPAFDSPEKHPAKVLSEGPLQLLYAGAVTEPKGIGDLLEAVAMLVHEGTEAALDVYGQGEALAAMQERAKKLGIDGHVRFMGLASHADVVEGMRQADLVIVPSRPEFPEGLPNVIYESFEARTPLICSDHPMFVRRLRDGRGCRIFRAGDPASLAAAVLEAVEGETYARLSETTWESWRALQCPVAFGELLEQWVAWTREGGDIPCLRHALAVQGASP